MHRNVSLVKRTAQCPRTSPKEEGLGLSVKEPSGDTVELVPRENRCIGQDTPQSTGELTTAEIHPVQSHQQSVTLLSPN